MTELSPFCFKLSLLPNGSFCEQNISRTACAKSREVVGSIPGRAIPKALKMVPVATLLGAQYNKASTGFSSPNKVSHNYPRNTAKINKSEKSLIIINVCIHWMTVWKTGSYAKYVILLKYRYYYYYYYYDS